MRFDIDGVDFAPYIARGGLKFQKFKVSSKDSGRDTQDAKMHLTVLAQKHKITATFRPLKAEEAATVFSTLGNAWVTVTFESPFTGGEYSCRMYSDDLPATFLMEKDGVAYYQGIEAPLIEE